MEKAKEVREREREKKREKRQGERTNPHRIMILSESACGRDVSVWIEDLLCGGIMVIMVSAE